ncbi:hypothetical protein [Gottfriedia solisilvae]|uniref:Uncharacterized protein n=1 Tax=Gottfriedia solisilvae TaxID=1516104 RepID=A0A8J3F391_9BACI|nr:hypothetical protein [Gottfriedia solisilvae]GGI15351.1 hypothetical protein GCM10007380_27540 [Gottfriedia solisilvae]
MSDKIKQEMNRIQIPNELHERAIIGVKNAKSEMTKRKNYLYKVVPLAVSIVFLSVGGYSVWNANHQSYENQNIVSSLDKNGVTIPAVELPKSGETAKMMPLFVYKGRIYTQSSTKIDPSQVKNLLDEKLGKTRAGLDEWSNQDDYAVEFASSIGEVDVYSVKGYQQEFRLMTYDLSSGYAEVYESLNGVTISSGSEIVEKLHLMNIAKAKSRTYDDWNNSTEKYTEINDKALLNSFVDALNDSIPYLREDVEAKLGNFQNNEQYKELTISLTDGTNVTLWVVKDGYISYGNALYFKIDHEVLMNLWNQMK